MLQVLGCICFSLVHCLIHFRVGPACWHWVSLTDGAVVTTEETSALAGCGENSDHPGDMAGDNRDPGAAGGAQVGLRARAPAPQDPKLLAAPHRSSGTSAADVTRLEVRVGQPVPGALWAPPGGGAARC